MLEATQPETATDKPTPATPDAASRLWQAFAQAHERDADNRRAIGKLGYQLRNLFSERSNSGGGRRTSGHGVFEKELKARGYNPRRVRECIRDYRVEIGELPPAESTAAKRKARRRTYAQGLSDGLDAVDMFAANAVAKFANLLSYRALKSAYLVRIAEVHPDHGGSEEECKRLIVAWAELEKYLSELGAEAAHAN